MIDREDITVILSVILILFIFISAIVSLCYMAAKHSCKKIGEETNFDTKYTLFAGCLIKDGTYVPLDNWRAVKE